VPFDASHSEHHRVLGSGEPPIPRLVVGGLPVVLSQTFRSLIHSRLALGMKGYERSHPDTDIVLVEPDQRDPTMFLANTFGYRQRRQLAEHAYQRTRADLRRRRVALSATLARHGLALDDAVLDDAHAGRLDDVLDDLERAAQRGADGRRLSGSPALAPSRLSLAGRRRASGPALRQARTVHRTVRAR
jgi:NTE family protein